MKPKEYITKYNLSETNVFNHNDFVFDLTSDFVTLLDVGNGKKNFMGYENAVRAIRMKWDAIHNKTVNGGLPDKLWNYFYAVVIAKTKEQLFPEQMKAKRDEKERKARIRGEWERFYEEQDREFGDWFWKSIFIGLLMGGVAKPESSFDVLGLDHDASAEDVKKKYRELSMVHHPDKGGNAQAFMNITEAKNKLLAYLEK